MRVFNRVGSLWHAYKINYSVGRVGGGLELLSLPVHRSKKKKKKMKTNMMAHVKKIRHS